MRFPLSLFFALSTACCISATSRAASEWRIADGGNGHRYEAVQSSTGFTWHEANTLATAVGGHLVTITSAAENQFVFNLINSPDYWRVDPFHSHGPWLGGYQPPGTSEPNGGWRWVTDEPFSFTNWRPGEPNNGGGVEDHLLYFSNASARLPTWNDGGANSRQAGFIIELPPAERSSKLYAIVVGSRAPVWDNFGQEYPDGVRGDVAVAQVSAALGWAEHVWPITTDWHDSDTLVTSLQTAFAELTSRITAGDTLLFYYMGHGSGGTSPLQDEELNATSGGHFTDDALTSFLTSARLDGVTKAIFLDSCHSFGFAASDGPFDDDLDTLGHIAVFASAHEDGTANVAADGVGWWTHAILPYLTPDSTFEQLKRHAGLAYGVGVEGFFLDRGYGMVTGEPPV